MILDRNEYIWTKNCEKCTYKDYCNIQMKSLCTSFLDELNLQRHTNIDKNTYIDKLKEENRILTQTLLKIRNIKSKELTEDLVKGVLKRLKIIIEE